MASPTREKPTRRAMMSGLPGDILRSVGMKGSAATRAAIAAKRMMLPHW
jgi:hypothetical protein